MRECLRWLAGCHSHGHVADWHSLQGALCKAEGLAGMGPAGCCPVALCCWLHGRPFLCCRLRCAQPHPTSIWRMYSFIMWKLLLAPSSHILSPCCSSVKRPHPCVQICRGHLALEAECWRPWHGGRRGGDHSTGPANIPLAIFCDSNLGTASGGDSVPRLPADHTDALGAHACRHRGAGPMEALITCICDRWKQRSLASHSTSSFVSSYSCMQCRGRAGNS